MFWCYFYPNIPTKTRQASFPEEENMIMQNDAAIQQVLNRTERRIEQIEQLDPVNLHLPTLKVLALPVSVNSPVIQPKDIYDLYKSWRGVKRVSGGVCIFLEPSVDDLDKSINLYTELNEYGVVYYRKRLYENSGISDFIHGINDLLKHVKDLYNLCDDSVEIQVHASVNNVFKEELARNLGRSGAMPLSSDPVCYDSEVCVSTAETYASTDFDKAEHRKTILEELTVPLLWAFNVPIDSDAIMKYIRELISKNV